MTKADDMEAVDLEARELAIRLAKEEGVQEGIKAVYEAGMRRGWQLAYRQGVRHGKSMLHYWTWSGAGMLSIGAVLGAFTYGFIRAVMQW